jgi:KDO2-lipid IV(A) lauroyltransferase
MVRRIWGNFSRVLADYPHLRSIWHLSDKVIEIVGEEHLEAARRSGAFLLVGAHFGHWELPAFYASRSGIKGTAIYSPDPNPLVDALLRRCRLRAGKNGVLVAKQSAAVRQVITALDRREAVFLLADHRVDDGSLIPFFGRPAMTTLTPARLARRFNCPILLARAEQLPHGRYRIIYHPPIRPNMALAPQRDILELTTQILQTFETWIRTTPEQWNYLKRRWPKHDVTAGSRETKSKPNHRYSRRRQGRAAA